MRKYALILLFIAPTLLIAQKENLYDTQHSMQFAQYLESSGQYKFAIQEYERLLFMEPGNTSLKLHLIRLYRKTGDYKPGINRVESLYPNQDKIPRAIALEYSNLLILNHSDQSLHKLIEKNSLLLPSDSVSLNFQNFLLHGQLDRSVEYFEKNQTQYPKAFAPYSDLISNIKTRKHRSQGLAIALSAIIPGAGKFYTGDWKDGLISLIFVGANAYQAYRGFFNKNGLKSAQGWIYSGIGMGFYLGNLYGSAKSAKLYNQNINHRLVHRARRIWDDQLKHQSNSAWK